MPNDTERRDVALLIRADLLTEAEGLSVNVSRAAEEGIVNAITAENKQFERPASKDAAVLPTRSGER